MSLQISIKNISASVLDFKETDAVGLEGEPLLIPSGIIAIGATEICESPLYKVQVSKRLYNYILNDQAELYIDGLLKPKADVLSWYEDLSAGNSNDSFKGVLAASPALGSDGDYYYNTVGNEYVYYDETRSKWLSMDSLTFEFGRDSATNNTRMKIGGSDTQCTDIAFEPSRRGCIIPSNCTIVKFFLSCESNDTEPSKFDLYVNNQSNSPNYTTTIAVGVLKKEDTTLNIDLTSSDIVGVKMYKTNTTNGLTTFVNGYFSIKRKY